MMMKKRILSLVMAMLMVIPMFPIHAHAWSEEVEDGVTCLYCGYFNFGDWVCDNCQLCSEEASHGTDCYEVTHCADCGCCLINEDNFCAECHKCAACAVGGNDHCTNPDCFRCCDGSEDEICKSCYLCSDCVDVCDVCGNCDSCIEFVEHTHCPICDYCFEGETDPCEDTHTKSHCTNECQLCEQCGKCVYESGDELCDTCGLCPDCCLENANNEGCECGEFCIEDSDWLDHICENCGAAFCTVEQCEFCGFCLDCCEGISECISGMCVEDPDYEEHFCEDCGACFCSVPQCEDCEAAGDFRCRDCCIEQCKDAGCDCGNRCINDNDFEEHVEKDHLGYLLKNHSPTPEARWNYNGTQHWLDCKYCGETKHRTQVANHTFDRYGTCTVCGASNSSAMVILMQPKDVNTAVTDNLYGDMEGKYSELNNTETFTTAVYSNSAVTYQWYYKNATKWTPLKDDFATYKNKTYPLVAGAKSPKLTIAVPTDACCEEYYYKCVITGSKGNKVETKAARLSAKHIYDHAVAVGAHKGIITLKGGKVVHMYEDKGHVMLCHGDGCEAEKKKVLRHHYGYDVRNGKKETITDETGGIWWVRTCTDCGFKKYVRQHDHSYTNAVVDYSYDSYAQHRLKCNYNGVGGNCEETTVEPHAWTAWKNQGTPWTTSEKIGYPYRDCIVCSHWSSSKLYRLVNGKPTVTKWTRSNDLVNVEYGSASSDIVQKGDELIVTFSPSDYDIQNYIKKANPKCTGWRVYYTAKGSSKTSKSTEVTSKFKFTPVDGGYWKVKCTIPTVASTAGGALTFVPTIAAQSCTHAGATKLVGKHDPVCIKSGYTGNVICLECGNVKKYGEAIPGAKTHQGTKTLIPRTAIKGTCTTRGYEGDYKCSVCNGKIKGKTTPKVHGTVEKGTAEIRNAIPATIHSGGYSGETYCKLCGEMIKEGRDTPRLDTTIRTVEISGLTAPKEGNTPDYSVTKPVGVKYGFNATKYPIIWTDETTHKELTSTSKFVAGHAYSVLIPVIPASNYTFANYGDVLSSVKATINDKNVSVRRYKDNSLDKFAGIYYYFGSCSKSLVSEITLKDVSAPVAGKTPVYTSTEVGTGYSRKETSASSISQVNGMSWFDATDEKTLGKTDVFKPNHVYQLYVDLVADDGFTFSSPKAYINGKKAKVESSSSKTAQISYIFDCGIQTVDSISVSGIESPVIDETPKYNISVQNTAAYRINPESYGDYIVGGVMWGTVSNGNPKSFSKIDKTDKFEKNKQYAVQVELIPKEIDGIPISKFTYNEKPKLLINGKSDGAAVVEVLVGGTSANVTYIFPTSHAHSFGGWIKGENSHYKECSCGEKTNVAPHIYDNDKDTTCNTCGYVRSIKSNHTHNYNIVKFNEDYHWYECSCGERVLYAEHSYNSDKDSVCKVCSYDKNHKHTYKTATTCATLSKNGKTQKTCSYCSHQSVETIYYPKTFTPSTKSYTYDGKAKKPTVTVKDSKGNTIAKSNYTLKYKNNTKIGTATVSVVFNGSKYKGTKNVTFKINPKGTTVSKVTAPKKGQLKVSWKKQTSNTTGYEIQIATDSKFTKNKKSFTISKNSTTSKTITGLKNNKKYYIRIRTYKTVNKTKYYSSWSKAKSVKTK